MIEMGFREHARSDKAEKKAAEIPKAKRTAAIAS
jgi:hypothetical protein